MLFFYFSLHTLQKEQSSTYSFFTFTKKDTFCGCSKIGNSHGHSWISRQCLSHEKDHNFMIFSSMQVASLMLICRLDNLNLLAVSVESLRILSPEVICLFNSCIWFLNALQEPSEAFFKLPTLKREQNWMQKYNFWCIFFSVWKVYTDLPNSHETNSWT